MITRRQRRETDPIVPVARAPVSAIVFAILLGACATTGDSGSRGGAGASAGLAGTAAGSPAGAGSSGGNRAVAGSSGSGSAAAGAPAPSVGDGGAVGEGSPCARVGVTRICCGRGVQTCAGTSEFPTWGPCLDDGGASIACDCAAGEFGCDAGIDAGTPPDAGTDSGTPPACGPGMVCKPGSIRYCDDPAAEWTQSTCDATGQWLPCVPATIPAAANGAGCAQDDYAPEMCCAVAVICCQDNPDGPFKDFGSGACAAVDCL